MRAIISTTLDDKYLFSVPIVAWCWMKLGVKVHILLPLRANDNETAKWELVVETMWPWWGDYIRAHNFEAPEHKKATYAQCSRLYAYSLDIQYNEMLITSDADMANFKVPPHNYESFTVFGNDLTPPNQYPICYLSAPSHLWQKAFGGGKSLQENLDELLGHIDCEHFSGNYWAKDQEEAWNTINKWNPITVPRARPGTQFASHRIDRDDTYWRERLNHDVIDAHLWRPGYEEQNFKNILELLRFFYPEESFEWIEQYREKYLKLI